MITNLAAAAADCNSVTWTDVAFVGVIALGVLGFFWLRWR